MRWTSDRNGAIDFDGDPRTRSAVGLTTCARMPAGRVAHRSQSASACRLRPMLLARGGRHRADARACALLAENGITTAGFGPPRRRGDPGGPETPGADTRVLAWLPNFYVITRYNRSSFYAMSVFELAEALRPGRLVEIRASERRWKDPPMPASAPPSSSDPSSPPSSAARPRRPRRRAAFRHHAVPGHSALSMASHYSSW